MAVDKLILTNRSALLRKYKKTGLDRLEKSIAQLIAADAKRGIQSKLVYLDDENIRAFGARAVSKVEDVRANKNAVDALYKKFRPDYVLLLGSKDVVPHVKLDNLTGDDDRLIIDSDLPYACEETFSRDGHHFLHPTRVVGRLPDVNGGRDVNYLLQLIRHAIAVKPRPRNYYDRWFALSTKEWTGSTAITVANLFGGLDQLLLSPPSKKGRYTKQANARIHFFNCHGGSKKPYFYGQHGNAYPESFHSDDVPQLQSGTFVAAECCYGAEQYKRNRHLSISAKYLLHGAAAYVGSTTVAYGPTEGQGQADLLTQYFVACVLRGHSVGRAFLEARQRFIAASAPRIDAVELKTLQQFILLGDPSLHLVNRKHRSLAIEDGDLVIEDLSNSQGMRKTRRRQLEARGKRVGDATTTPKSARSTITKTRHKAYAMIAKENGLHDFRMKVFDYGDGKNKHYCFVEKKKANVKQHRPRIIFFQESGEDVTVKVYEQK